MANLQGIARQILEKMDQNLYLKFNTLIHLTGMIGVAHNAQKEILELSIMDLEAGMDLNTLKDGVLMFQ